MIHPQNTFNQKVKGVEPVSDRLLVKDGFSCVSGVYSWWE